MCLLVGRSDLGFSRRATHRENSKRPEFLGACACKISLWAGFLFPHLEAAPTTMLSGRRHSENVSPSVNAWLEIGRRGRAAVELHGSRCWSRAQRHLRPALPRFPKWHETIAIPVPEALKDTPPDDLYIHVLLWDYDSLKEDHLVAQASFPLSRMPRAAARGAAACAGGGSTCASGLRSRGREPTGSPGRGGHPRRQPQLGAWTCATERRLGNLARGRMVT